MPAAGALSSNGAAALHSPANAGSVMLTAGGGEETEHRL